MALSSYLRAHWRAGVAIAVLVAAAIAYAALGSGSTPPATITIARGDVPTQVAVTGTVTAATEADLGFAESGRIARTYAIVGQHVAAGAVLAVVENANLAATVAQKQATLDSLLSGTRPETIQNDQSALLAAGVSLSAAAQSAYAAADEAVRTQTDEVYVEPPVSVSLFPFSISDNVFETKVENERAALTVLLNDWKDALTASSSPASEAALADQDLAMVSAYLNDLVLALTEAKPSATITTYKTDAAGARTSAADAATALASAESAYTSAEGALTLAQAGSTADDIAVARADLANAQAALAQTEVVAPFSGVVTKMDTKEGEIVSPSTSEIAMQSDGVFEIDAYIPEVSIAGVSVGDEATTTLDAYGPAVPFAAQVIAIDPAETEQDGVPTYKTTLAFAGPDPRIRSGMTAEVSITTGILHDATVLPAGAIGHDASGTYVSVLLGKKVERRAITEGAPASLGEVEVTSGLSPGDMVLVTPAS